MDKQEMNIIENPQSKELFAHVGGTIYAFDGTPYTVPADVTGWPIVAQVENVDAWIAAPGDCRTYYGAVTVTTVEKSGCRSTFKMGDNISYLLNWLSDARETLEAVSYQWIGAYSDRNVARSKAEV